MTSLYNNATAALFALVCSAVFIGLSVGPAEAATLLI